MRAIVMGHSNCRPKIAFNTLLITTYRDPFSFSVNLTMYHSIPIVSPWVTKRDCSQRKRRMGLFEVFDILKYRMAGKFGGEFNLADNECTAKLNSANILS